MAIDDRSRYTHGCHGDAGRRLSLPAQLHLGRGWPTAHGLTSAPGGRVELALPASVCHASPRYRAMGV